MKKKITIIGGGFSSWVAASVFADNGYYIDIFEGKNEFFGSQQITPNGWQALSKLIKLKNIRKHFEPFYNIYIKRLNSKNNLELLYHYDLVEKNYKNVFTFFFDVKTLWRKKKQYVTNTSKELRKFCFT